MFRLLFRLILFVIVLGVIAVFALGYRWSSRPTETNAPAAAGGEVLDTGRARRAGADIAEKVAEGASRAGKALEEGKLTAKIKSKLALDDTIDASDVTVSTEGTVVTLRGTVVNRKQHQRVVQLAQETAGVTSVADKLSVREAR
jgi:hyperosmotically inducible protein